MGKLMFIGLGLNDEKDITIRGLERIRESDMVFAEFYTGRLTGTTLERMESQFGKKIIVLNRDEVESGERIIEAARHKTVSFITVGDAMAATTHVSLRLKAINEGVETEIIHNASIITAAASVTGLQHYKFGRVATIPFPQENYSPTSPYDVIKENMKMGLHTLILLDIDEKENRCMTANEGMNLLLEIERRRGEGLLSPDTVICVVGRAGSEKPVVRAGKISKMLSEDFGPPLHALIIPGKLHFMEEEALRKLGGWK